MFPQSALGMFVAGEQDEGVPGGTSVREADEQNAVPAAAHWTSLFESLLLGEEVEHLLVGGGEREAPHPHDDLVLSGEELCHLIGGSWSAGTEKNNFLTSFLTKRNFNVGVSHNMLLQLIKLAKNCVLNRSEFLC